MALGVLVKDPNTNQPVRVNNENAAYVIDEGVPIFGQPPVQIIFRDYFRDSTGSNDMSIAPPASGTEFIIKAPSDNSRERYITNLSFVIAQQNASLNVFANIGVLTNGVDIEYSSTVAEDGFVSLSNGGLKTNFEFVRLCLGTPPIGGTTTAFRASKVSGNDDGYTPFLDLRKVFGVSFGVKLRAASPDKFIIRVNDDLSAATEFTCIASGFDRINPPIA